MQTKVYIKINSPIYLNFMSCEPEKIITYVKKTLLNRLRVRALREIERTQFRSSFRNSTVLFTISENL